MFIDRQGTNQQAQKLNLSCSNTKSHKKSSFPDILICVDLALKMGNQQDSTAHRWYSCAC